MKYWTVRITKGNHYAGTNEGGVIDVTEPIALSLIASGVAEAVGETKTLLSRANTKTIDSRKVAVKG
jgi:hypothetical protein